MRDPKAGRRIPLGPVGAMGSVLLFLSSVARGADPPPRAWPRVGGHVGTIIPTIDVSRGGVNVIGRDFIQYGIAQGITVKMDPHWAIDVGVTVVSFWERNKVGYDAVKTRVVAGPAVVYDYGPLTVDLALVMQTGEGVPFNSGLVPGLSKGIKVGTVTWFVELDFPLFLYGDRGRLTESLAVVPHTGISF
jgi:hypothetical protein